MPGISVTTLPGRVVLLHDREGEVIVSEIDIEEAGVLMVSLYWAIFRAMRLR